MRIPSLGPLVAAIGLLTTPACSSFNDRATHYAKTQLAATNAARPAAAFAYEICRDGATYAYFRERFGMDRPAVAATKLWTEWYCTESAPDVRGEIAVLPHPPTAAASWCAAHATMAAPPAGQQHWVDYCDDMDRTGQAFNVALLFLGEYATAMDSVAGGKPFDASGISSMAAGANTLLGAVNASTAVTTAAKGIGGALSGAATPIVQMAQEHQLHGYVQKADPQVTLLIKSLTDYLSFLRDELDHFAAQRDNVLRQVSKLRTPGGPLPEEAELLNAYEISSDRQHRFEEIRASLDRYKAILGALQAAHEALASENATDTAAKLAAFDGKVRDLEAAALPRLTLQPIPEGTQLGQRR